MRIEFLNAAKLNEVVGRISLDCGDRITVVDVIPTSLANVAGMVPVHLVGHDIDLDVEDGVLDFGGRHYQFSWDGDEDTTLAVSVF